MLQDRSDRNAVNNNKFFNKIRRRTLISGNATLIKNYKNLQSSAIEHLKNTSSSDYYLELSNGMPKEIYIKNHYDKLDKMLDSNKSVLNYNFSTNTESLTHWFNVREFSELVKHHAVAARASTKAFNESFYDFQIALMHKGILKGPGADVTRRLPPSLARELGGFLYFK